MNDVERRTKISGYCLVLLSLLLLTNPITRVVYRGDGASLNHIAATGFVAPLTMALTIGAVYAITQLLRKKADRAGLIGAALTLMGATVGSRIMVLAQLEGLLKIGGTGVPGDALEKMFNAAPIVWVSIVPVGILYPLGLMTLGTALFFARTVPRWVSLLLVLGGVLFPVGRAVGVEWAVGLSDLALGVGFGAIGVSVLRWFAREDVGAHEGELRIAN